MGRRVARVQILSHEEFAAVHRNKLPVVTKHLQLNWRAKEQWGNAEGFLVSTEGTLTGNLLTLAAKDGVHFMKIGLCDTLDVPLEAVLGRVFPGDAPQLDAAAAAAQLPSRLYARAPLTAPLKALCGSHEPHCRLVLGEGAAEEQQATFKDNLCGVWISTHGNITPLHFDLCHGFLNQVRGRKRVTLFAPDDAMYLYRSLPGSENPFASRVCLDEWMSGCERQRGLFPNVAEAEPLTVDLAPGDSLYIPPFWRVNARC